MNDQRAFLWPRLVVGIQSEPGIQDELCLLLTDRGANCLFRQNNTLVLDLSLWQVQGDSISSAELAIARFQHFLNLYVSPLHYSIGISSDPVMAFHAADVSNPGQEKWILPWGVQLELERVSVSALHVLHKDMPVFFHQCGKQWCSQLRETGKEFLVRRFGNAGEKLWCLLHDRVHQEPEVKQLPSGEISWRVSLPVRTRSMRSLSAHLWRLYITVNRNLERLHRQAERLELKYQVTENFEFDKHSMQLNKSMKNRHDLNRHIEQMQITKNGIARFQITASSLFHPAGQLDLF